MPDKQLLIKLFLDTRSGTEKICSFLEVEDHVVQPIVDVSPPKWHLGHTTWFFEEFFLSQLPGHKPFDIRFSYVFNSYYESVGERVLRPDRGNLTRPTVKEVLEYRKAVTKKVISLLEEGKDISENLLQVLELGIHHEKQHQELLYTDIKYILGSNPLFPVYNENFEENHVEKEPQKWIKLAEGIYEIGHNNKEFCYDNELGWHKVFLHEFEISNRLITNKEFLEFVEDGGYEKVLLWHSEAWEWIQQNGVSSPLYWHRVNGVWHQFTMKGLVKLIPEAPVTHISYYEAFAFAEWRQMRLPSEFEWEASQQHFKWGSRWEWTESAYLPYPGYSKAEGAIGEYNGKFMVNQKVLRGSSVASSPDHIRPTYRNFFHPHLRWQFTGIRLAKKQILGGEENPSVQPLKH